MRIQSGQRRYWAFTLIELLVGIAIIGGPNRLDLDLHAAWVRRNIDR